MVRQDAGNRASSLDGSRKVAGNLLAQRGVDARLPVEKLLSLVEGGTAHCAKKRLYDVAKSVTEFGTVMQQGISPRIIFFNSHV